MIVSRALEGSARSLFEKYPVLTVTGPRRSGKTTLCRKVIPNLPYVSLESPDRREFAADDPRGFLREYADGAILDEIQRAPDLVTYIHDVRGFNPKKQHLRPDGKPEVSRFQGGEPISRRTNRNPAPSALSHRGSSAAATDPQHGRHVANGFLPEDLRPGSGPHSSAG